MHVFVLLQIKYSTRYLSGQCVRFAFVLRTRETLDVAVGDFGLEVGAHALVAEHVVALVEFEALVARFLCHTNTAVEVSVGEAFLFLLQIVVLEQMQRHGLLDRSFINAATHTHVLLVVY